MARLVATRLEASEQPDSVQSGENVQWLTLLKSLAGRRKDHRATVHGLGLKKVNQVSELVDTPAGTALLMICER